MVNCSPVSHKKSLDFSTVEATDSTYHRRQIDIFSAIAIGGGSVLLALYNRQPQNLNEYATQKLFKYYHEEKKKSLNFSVPYIPNGRTGNKGGGSKHQGQTSQQSQVSAAHPYPGAGYGYYQDSYGNWGIGPSQPGGTPPTPTPNWKKPTPASAVGSRVPDERSKKRKQFQPETKELSWSYSSSGSNQLWYKNTRIGPNVLQSAVPEVINLESSDEEVEFVGIVNPWENVVIHTPVQGRKRILSTETYAQSTAPKVARVNEPIPGPSGMGNPPPPPSPITHQDSSSSSKSSKSVISLQSSSDGLDGDGNPIARPVNPTPPAGRSDAQPFDSSSVLYEGGIVRSQFTIRGFNHFTPSVSNACTLDTFLSAILFRALRFHAGPEAFVQNYFRLEFSLAEDTIRNIIRNAVSNPQGHDDSSKLMWATDVMLRRRARSRSIDIAGDAVTNVLSHFEQSTLVFREYSCVCPNQDRAHTAYETMTSLPYSHMSVSSVPGRRVGMRDGPNFQPTHNQFNSGAGGPSPWADKSFRCGTCNGHYVQSAVTVPDTTWMVWQDIQYEHMVTDFATSLEFHRFDSRYGRVTFDLGYVSLVSRSGIDHVGATLTHNIGLMWFENNYYLYDDMAPTQIPILVIDPNLLLAKWEIRQVVYFRR